MAVDIGRVHAKKIANAPVDRLRHHAHVVLTADDKHPLTQAAAGRGAPLTNEPAGQLYTPRGLLLATTGQFYWRPLDGSH